MTSATPPLAENQPSDRFSGLGRGPANHVPLSPLGFLSKTAHMHPDQVAIIHGDLRQTWARTHARCRRLASALTARGIAKGDTVAIIAPNTPAMVEAHFGVPMAGAVLNTLNTRLDPEAIAFQLAHGVMRPLHSALMPNLGIAFTEICDLSTLADDCAADGQLDFLYVAAPLKVVNGAGTPINPVVIK